MLSRVWELRSRTLRFTKFPALSRFRCWPRPWLLQESLAIVCAGTIIRGQTPHFEYISGEVARGIGQAALQTGVPIVFGVITTDNKDQAIARAGVKQGNKGFEAATVAVELANLYKKVKSEK